MFEDFPATSCGTDGHDSDCLCDVVVDKPVEVMKDWGRDSFMVKRLVEELGIGQPWYPSDLLRLLELQTMLHDDVVAYETRVAEGSTPVLWQNKRKFSPGQLRHVEQMYDDGWTGRQVRAYCRLMWGIEATRSHVSKLNDRAKERKERNAS